MRMGMRDMYMLKNQARRCTWAAIVIWILFLEYLSHCPSLCRQVPMLVNQNKNLYEFIILEFFLKRIFHLADVSLAIFKPSP